MTKDILRNGDAISGAVLAALGAYIFLESRNWAYYTEDGPGPAFFPTWYGLAMIALSLALVISAIRKAQKPDEYDWPGIGRALATWLAFAISAVLMAWLGFLISFMLLTFFVVVVVFRRPPLTAAYHCGQCGGRVLSRIPVRAERAASHRHLRDLTWTSWVDCCTGLRSR